MFSYVYLHDKTNPNTEMPEVTVQLLGVAVNSALVCMIVCTSRRKWLCTLLSHLTLG